MITRIVPSKFIEATHTIAQFQIDYPASARDALVKFIFTKKMWQDGLIENYQPPLIKEFQEKGVFVEEGAIIDSSAILEPGVYIHAGVTIGKNVIIETGAVIGGCGFGYIRDPETNELWQFPQIGGVIIEDNVQIGNNTAVDRGALKNTILHKNCKIDNLVHIAHNVEVGENSMVIAGAMIAGSVKIGENSQIAPQTSIMNQITIGCNTLIGMHSCVTKNIPDNTVAYGVPAKIKE